MFVDYAMSVYIVLVGLAMTQTKQCLAEFRVSNIDGAQFFSNVVHEADGWARLEICFFVMACDFEILRKISSSAISERSF